MKFKKRSKSQRIGESGEAYVKYWATKNNFTATKFENDYGYDFTFMGFSKIKEYEIANGISFLAQCKATENKNEQYVTIDKTDAGLYLSSSTPFCILAVDLTTETVAYRFGDNYLVDELVKFVNSAHDFLNLPIVKEFATGNDFSASSKKYAHQCYFSRLKTYIAQKLLQAKSPGIKLTVSNDEDGMDIIVESQWITNVVNPKMLFCNNQKSDIFVNSEVAQIFRDYYPGFRSLLVAGSIGLDSKISASPSGRIAKSVSYPYDGNICFRTKSGFTFIAGPCEEVDGQHVHKTTFTVEESILPIIDCIEDLNAFSEILASDELLINGHCLCNVSSFKPLQSFLQSFCDVKALSAAGIQESSRIHASDLNGENAFITVTLIARLIERINIVKDFVVHGNDEFERSKASGVLPVVFQINSQKYVAKVMSDFELFTHDGYIVGLGGVHIKNVAIEIFAWEKRDIPAPELWFHSNYPAIPLGIAKSQTITGPLLDLPYEIEID